MHQQFIDLLAVLEASGKSYNIAKITEAYEFAALLHCDQVRKSGESYICHPIAVAEIVVGLGLDTDAVCAALLHDTIEDCGDAVDIPTIKKKFGEDVANLVDGVTKLIRIQFIDTEEQQIENLRKMFLAMSKDIRVIFIKLCDRLHNMRTLDAKPEPKRRITALETMQVFAPLAHRLGVQTIKQELETLSLFYLDPIGYAEIRSHVETRYGRDIDFLQRVQQDIENKLRESGHEFEIDGRVKSTYSIYKKVFEQGKRFDEVYDFFALRIITETEADCYIILGIMHEMFKSVPGKFKDYISTPKPNMYRSIHTTVIGRDGVPIELQIRTHEMHNIADYGVAAHWKYKTGANAQQDIDQKLSWIAKLIEEDESTRDHDEYLSTLKIDIFHDETFVFTPKGDVVTLPYGSTLIDFAYAIHSEVGNKMTGAKINGAIAPIDSVPVNGQIVEILTSKSAKGPSRDWLKIVKTSEARSKIRQWYKKEKRTENITVGRGEVEKELKKYGKILTEEQRNSIIASVASRLCIASADDLLNMIGYSGISMQKVILRLTDEVTKIVKSEEIPETLLVEDVVVKPAKKSSGRGVIIDELDGCDVKFSKCCNPLPGDSILGFITKGHGISVHKKDCPNVIDIVTRDEYRERFVTAKWESNEGSKTNTFEAFIQILAENTLTLIADITTNLANMNVSLHQINTQTKSSSTIVVNIVVGCKNTDHYRSILARLKSLPNILEVSRGFS